MGLAAGVMFQGVFLPTPSYEGTLSLMLALAVDVIVIIRLIFALLLRERNRGWIFYAFLPSLSVPAILCVEKIFWHL